MFCCHMSCHILYMVYIWYVYIVFGIFWYIPYCLDENLISKTIVCRSLYLNSMALGCTLRTQSLHACFYNPHAV